MNTNIIINLQYALKQNNYIVTITTRQFYNGENDVFVKYHEVRHNNKVIYSVASRILVAKFLGYIYRKSNEYKQQKAHPESMDDYMKKQIAQYIEEEKFNGKKKEKT